MTQNVPALIKLEPITLIMYFLMCKTEEYRHGKAVLQFTLEFNRQLKRIKCVSLSNWILHVNRKSCTSELKDGSVEN